MADTCLDTPALQAALASLPQWSIEDGHLCRRYRTTGWKATMMAANAVAFLAEAAWHHPDLELSYGRLAVRLQTHDASGITMKDVALARQIEQWLTAHDSGRPPEAAILADR